MFIRPPLRKRKHILEICQKLVNSPNTWCIVFNICSFVSSFCVIIVIFFLQKNVIICQYIYKRQTAKKLIMK